VLTTFSSTTKSSLQPHDDKLLIGIQQFIINAYFLCACYFPNLISVDLLHCSFRHPFLSSILQLSLEQQHAMLLFLWFMMTATCFTIHDRQSHLDVLNDIFIMLALVIFMQWPLFSLQITRELYYMSNIITAILLIDVYISQAPISLFSYSLERSFIYFTLFLRAFLTSTFILYYFYVFSLPPHLFYIIFTCFPYLHIYFILFLRVFLTSTFILYYF